MANSAGDEWPWPSRLPTGSDRGSITPSSESSTEEAAREFSCDGVGYSPKTTIDSGNVVSQSLHHIGMSNTPKLRLPKAPPPPRQKATVKQLAEEKTSSHAHTDVEAQILARIRKCLDRANHPNTPEMEAKAALHMSSRLMAQYNVTQVDLLAQATESEQQKEYAGQSTVSITCAKDPFAKVISQTWVHRAAAAIELFFDCKSYSAARIWSIDWTFYGIAPNTVAAAVAFEMAHNLTLEWARGKKGITNSYCLGVAQGLYEMAREGKRREEHEARQREEDALAARLKEEQLERQKELDRLNNDVGMTGTQEVCYVAEITDEGFTLINVIPSYDLAGHNDSSSDTDDDDIAHLNFNDQFEESMEAEPTFREENNAPLDPEADFEVELQRILKRERSCTPLAKVKCESSASQTKLEEGVMNIKPDFEYVEPKLENEDKIKLEKEDKVKLKEEDKAHTENSLWTSASQLTLFRATATKIAEEYLKSTDTKLRKGRVRVSSIRDHGAYEQGRKDSRKIDVKRRRIE